MFLAINHKNEFEFGPVVQEKMLFKYICYLKLWWPSCAEELNQLCIFEEGIMRNNTVK